MKFNFGLLLLGVCLFSGASMAKGDEEPKELYWEDMVPQDYVVPPSAIDHNGQMTQVETDAPLLQELNGQFVKIPGCSSTRRRCR
jgi:hypothetical protein